MDIDALRTFVAVAEQGQFQAAADELRISQQAVSQRIARLERELGAVLLTRTPRGSRPSVDGQALLPHARAALSALEQAARSVHPDSRPLRIDVVNRRIAPAQAVARFYRAWPQTPLDVLALGEETAAGASRAVLAGDIDATFRALPRQHLLEGLEARRLLDVPMQLLVGPKHPLAAQGALRPGDLAGHRIWIPGIREGTEWEQFYGALSAAFDLSIDGIGPHFGDEALLDALAESASLATLVGDSDRYVWPEGYGLRRIPLHDPTPVYPHALITRSGDSSAALAQLRAHLESPQTAADDAWVPEWTVRERRR